MIINVGCKGQPANQYQLLGGCEGCEAIFETDLQSLNEIDTLPDFDKNGKKIKLFGTVHQTDGVSPAEDVVLYFYHT
jgi:protocatechuate 3,4-dioxygenase beta subunit